MMKFPLTKYASVFMAFWLTCGSAVSLAAVEQSDLDRLDKLFNDHLSRTKAPGFSVAVVKDGKIVLAKGYGKKVINQPASMTPDTILSIGSLTKSFTAMAILQLQEKGLLNVDDPVIKYLPWFRSSDKSRSDHITLRMMLNNASGLSPRFSNLSRNLSREADALEKGVRAMSSYEMTRKPGESFEYLNEGWNTLGLIIEKITGMSWESYQDLYILKPLRMLNSSSSRPVIEAWDVAKGHYTGITPVPASLVHIQGSLPAGSGFFSTVNNLAHYLMALLQGGEWEGKTLLTQSSMAELWKPTVAVTGLSHEMGGNGKAGHYAMGWFISEIDGATYVSHGGEARTSSSQAMIDPAHNSAVVLLYNSGNVEPYSNESHLYVSHNALRILKGLPLSQFAVPREQDPLLNDFPGVAENLERYYGVYLSDSGNRIRIEAGGSEGLQGFLQEDIYPSDFDVDFISDTSIVLRNYAQRQQGLFTYNEDGSVASLTRGRQIFRKKQALDRDKFSEYQSQEGDFSFALPKIWAVNLQKGGFQATKEKGVSLTGQITEQSFEEWQEKSGDIIPISELKNGYIFRGGVIENAVQGRKEVILFSHTQQNDYVFTLSMPIGKLTHEVIQSLNPFLASLDLR